jgi:hypothetical protein
MADSKNEYTVTDTGGDFFDLWGFRYQVRGPGNSRQVWGTEVGVWTTTTMTQWGARWAIRRRKRKLARQGRVVYREAA